MVARIDSVFPAKFGTKSKNHAERKQRKHRTLQVYLVVIITTKNAEALERQGEDETEKNKVKAFVYAGGIDPAKGTTVEVKQKEEE